MQESLNVVLSLFSQYCWYYFSGHHTCLRNVCWFLHVPRDNDEKVCVLKEKVNNGTSGELIYVFVPCSFAWILCRSSVTLELLLSYNEQVRWAPLKFRKDLISSDDELCADASWSRCLPLHDEYTHEHALMLCKWTSVWRYSSWWRKRYLKYTEWSTEASQDVQVN